MPSVQKKKKEIIIMAFMCKKLSDWKANNMSVKDNLFMSNIQTTDSNNPNIMVKPYQIKSGIISFVLRLGLCALDYLK